MEDIDYTGCGCFYFERIDESGGRCRYYPPRNLQFEKVPNKCMCGQYKPCEVEDDVAQGVKMNQLIKIVKDIIAREWYGSLTIKFQKGKIVLFEKKETIKPE